MLIWSHSSHSSADLVALVALECCILSHSHSHSWDLEYFGQFRIHNNSPHLGFLRPRKTIEILTIVIFDYCNFDFICFAMSFCSSTESSFCLHLTRSEPGFGFIYFCGFCYFYYFYFISVFISTAGEFYTIINIDLHELIEF